MAGKDLQSLLKNRARLFPASQKTQGNGPGGGIGVQGRHLDPLCLDEGLFVFCSVQVVQKWANAIVSRVMDLLITP